jgi:L-aspartate oxidase
MTDLPDLDLLIVGSGVAGLSAAVAAAEAYGLRVGVLTKGDMEQSNTRWAQGGVAAVLNEDPDSTDLHLADTIAAGAGLCDPDAVRVMVDEGPGRVHGLIALGAVFDRDASGQWSLAMEGGHSHARVLHAGGAATGWEIERALVSAVQRLAVGVLEHTFAVDFVVEQGRCRGVRAMAEDGTPIEVRAEHTMLAAGGSGQLFAVTTNPRVATGDGIAMALRAGVAVADVEFVQFHPTALHHPAMPRPLLSEALRGHGALLRDGAGERFVDELQPRDIVSRAITATMLSQGIEHVWLDATALDSFDLRFPTIAAALAEVGLDASTDWLPVAPAAHYHCGGVVTDLDGATQLPGLWAAGEVACAGVHGANRLASNSLLDGMVFSIRAIEAIAAGVAGPSGTGAMAGLVEGSRSGPVGVELVPYRSSGDGDLGERGEPDEPDEPGGADPVVARRERLQAAMTKGAGVLRDADSLAETAAVLDAVAGDRTGPPVAVLEVENLLEVASALLASALRRTETRGAHTRRDHPDTDPELRKRFVLVAEDRT